MKYLEKQKKRKFYKESDIYRNFNILKAPYIDMELLKY